MNNYNELMNKPRINNKEIIGNVDIPVPSSDQLLPTVTSENAGQVLVVDDSGHWTTGTVSGGGATATNNYNLNSTVEVENND